MTTLEKIKAEIEQTADEEQKHDEKWAMGLRYAVKILDKYAEQEPCEDAISREDELKIIYGFKERHTEDREKHPINYGTLLDLIMLTRSLPPVRPQEPKWIPISERLPKEGEDVLACFYTSEGNYKMMVSRRSDSNYWDGVGRTADMVAWMPLPAHYKPQESEDKE